MVRETSIEAYKQLQETLPELELKVYNTMVELWIINDEWPTDRNIRDYLRITDKSRREWEMSDVTARRNGLVFKGIVIAGDKVEKTVRNQTRHVYTWQIKHPPSYEASQQRRAERPGDVENKSLVTNN